MPKLPRGQFYLARDKLGFIVAVKRLAYWDEVGAFKSTAGSIGVCDGIIKRLVRGQTRIPKGRQALVKITVEVLELLPKE